MQTLTIADLSHQNIYFAKYILIHD